MDPSAAMFGTSPPTHFLGSPMQLQPSFSQAAPLPQTSNPTPLDTPDLAAQKSGNEQQQGYYSSRGKSLQRQ